MATMSARYTVIDGEVIAQERGGVRHQLVPDPLGSTVALYDDSGIKTDTFSYWPYGESSIRMGITLVAFQYIGRFGYYNDGNTTNYVRARYLNKKTGRWITEDKFPIQIADKNLFRYVGNRSLTYIDTKGLHQVIFGDPPAPNNTKYCGATRKCPGIGEHSSPVDCIDRACAEHDRCIYKLDPKYTFWPSFDYCAIKMCVHAKQCLISGCSRDKDPQACEKVASWISIFFCKWIERLEKNPIPSLNPLDEWSKPYW